ncbi:MAG: phosphatidylglycerophosphatase A [Candidatus Omnitrophota bacterium]
MKHRDLRQKTLLSLSTFFGTGYLPLIPGTFGSCAGVLLYYFIKDNSAVFLLVTFICIVVGLFVSGRTETVLGQKDAKCIVIDEVSGMLLSLLYLPYDIKLVVIAFFLFRILDTLKPYPANKFQEFKGSFGVMGDDLVAGLYTNIIIQSALRLATFRAS